MNLEKLEKMVLIFEKLYWTQDCEEEDIRTNISCAMEHLAFKIAEETEKEETTPPPLFSQRFSIPEKERLQNAIDSIEKAFRE